MPAFINPYFVFVVENDVTFGLWVILLGVKVFALADCVTHKDAAFVAADKQNKALWMVLLVVFLVVHVLLFGSALHLLNLIGTVVALVYLADVRPALRGLRQR